MNGLETQILTIGGYGHSKADFFGKLQKAEVDLLVDIRQRRGMRGSLYSFLNASALQAELSAVGIDYKHLKVLAPTSEVRDRQKLADKGQGVLKSYRENLSPEFIAAYKQEILSACDIGDVVRQLSQYQRVCFFCVERSACACHRSLVADWLSGSSQMLVIDL